MVRPQEQVKVYGRAILNGRYIPKAAGKEDLIPVFEWHLFLEDSEWQTVRDALQMCESTGAMQLAVRVGMPESVTPETIENDSMNTRLLIYRVWVTTWAAFSKNELGKNIAWQYDVD